MPALPLLIVSQPLTAVTAEAWDHLVSERHPFMRHAFLLALEQSQSVGPVSTGWEPLYLMGFSGDTLVMAVPLYQKTDSFGEYIFDWQWAHAAQAANIPYYPKLVMAAPFTPATGPRILLAEGIGLEDVMPVLTEALSRIARERHASGIHVLFCQEHEAQAFARFGFIPRLSHQYHWHLDPAWHNFDDFLGSLRSSSRKQVRRERERAQSHGLEFSMRPLTALGASDRDALYAFYRQTVWEKGAQAYLTHAFFSSLSVAGIDAWVAMAHRGDEPMAASLFFRGDKTLYGRYWGCREPLDSLHFELCYYLPIAFCIAHRIEHFEAGAQGEHKIKRGLMPKGCHSAHLLRHPGLHQAVSAAVANESQHVSAHMAMLATHGPFHRTEVNS